MVQQISALIVQPAVDASKYTAGAQEKVAADKAMVTSAREAGAAQQGLSVVLTDTSAKITTTGDVVTRLERVYVQGAKQASMFERDLNALNRALETGKTDIADAANILIGMNQKLGLSADASSLAASGQGRLAAAVELANDRLRQQTTLLNDVTIAEARAAQTAENRRQAAAANQGKFNQVLGVGGPATSASASAGVFQAEFDRLEQIAGLKAQQIGKNFSADLDASLSTGISKAARDSAAIFEAEFTRIDEIANLKAQQAGSIFRADLNSSFGIGTSGKSASASASVFEQAARESEMYEQKARDLRAVLGDVSVMQDRLNAELAEYAVLAERGLITSDQLAKAQQMARKSAAGGVSSGMARAAGFNAGQQLQDIAMMSIIGQSPGTLALQQGPQLATAIQQGGGLAALGTGLASLLSVTTLLTIGFTAATAATIQWFMKGKDGAKSFNEALKAHSDALALLKDQYGALGEAAKTAGNAGGIAFTDASARNARALVEAQLRMKMSPFMDTIGGNNGWSKFFFGNGVDAEGLRNLSGDQKQFAGPVTSLLEAVRQGNSQDGLKKFRADVEGLYSTLAGKSNAPTALRATADAVELLGENAFSVSGKFAPFADAINKLKVAGPEGLSTFNAEVQKIGQQNGIQKIADEAIIAGKEVVDLAEKAKELEKVLSRLDFMASRPGLADQRALRSYVSGRDADVRILDQQFAADQQMAFARTNAEKLAAVEAQVRARAKEDGDKGGGLQARIDRALEAERNRQSIDLRDATEERHRAQKRIIESGKEELSLIGATAGEAARLNYQYAEMARLKEEAERRDGPGAIIDPEEEARVKRVADALAKIAEAGARLNLNNELSFERGQFFRSPIEQQIAARQKSAGLPIDMNSPEAMQMRQLDRMERVYERGMSFWDDFENGIKRGDKFGKALGDAIRNAVIEELTDVARNAFSNFLKEGIKTLMPGLGGGSPSTGASGIVGTLLGGANDNYAKGAVTRAPLPDIGSFAAAGFTKTGIPLAGISAQGLGAKVNAAYADRFQGLLNDLTAAGYPIKSLGEGGYSYRNVAGSKSLSNHAFGNAIDINPRQNPWAVGAKGNFAQYGIDPNELAQKNGLFWGGNWNKSDAMHFQVDKTAKALDKLSTSSIDTAKSLEGGLGKLGNSLGQFPAAPGGGGGLLGSLLGGLNSAFAGSKAFNYLSANPGGYIGLFDSGGSILNGNVVPFGPKTRSLGNGIFADSGFGPGHFPAILEETESVLTRDMMGRTMRALRGVSNQHAGGGSAAPSGIADVRVFVDQDGNWQAKVEKISQGPARKESNRAVGNYAYHQSNGGAKADDHRYQRLKRRV